MNTLLKKKIYNFKNELLKLHDPARFNTLCDEFFEYNYSSVEESLVDNAAPIELYLSEALKEEALNTSWYDYYQLMKYTNNKVLDVGSGYSKGTLLSLTLGYGNIYSVEFVPERIQWAITKALELNLDTSYFKYADALSIDHSEFDIFLIYQPTGKFLTSLLNKLTIFDDKEIWAIESHGDLIYRLSLDTRLIHKKQILSLSSKRHDNSIYSFKTQCNDLTPLLEFEKSLYSKEYLEYSDFNSIFGKFSWIMSTKNAFVDYIDGVATLEVNGKRITLEKELSNLKFVSSLNNFQKKYLNQSYIDFKGRRQRIIKVISYPEDSLELSTSGRITL